MHAPGLTAVCTIHFACQHAAGGEKEAVHTLSGRQLILRETALGLAGGGGPRGDDSKGTGSGEPASGPVTSPDLKRSSFLIGLQAYR